MIPHVAPDRIGRANHRGEDQKRKHLGGSQLSKLGPRVEDVFG